MFNVTQRQTAVLLHLFVELNNIGKTINNSIDLGSQYLQCGGILGLMNGAFM